jgi:hypothetical protein
MREILARNFMPVALDRPVWRVAVPALWVLLLLALAPYQSLARDLWTDEAFTVSYTTYQEPGAVLADVRKNEETPPVYFMIAWVWSRFAGQSEVALRLLSLLFGALAVAILGSAARRWLPAADASLAGYLLAVLTPVGLYIVTARSYALMLLMAVICTVAFEWLYRNPTDRRALVGYAIAMAVFCLTSYFAAAFVAAHNLIWLSSLVRQPAQRRRRLLDWLAAQIGIGAVVLPWLPSLAYQFKAAHFVTDTTQITAAEYFWQAYSLLAVPPSASFWLMIWLPLTVLIWALVAIGLRSSGKADGGLVLRVFAVPAVAQLLLVIWMQAAAWRYLTILLPGAVLAVAAGAGALRRQAPRVGQAVMLALVLGLLIYRLSGTLAPNTAQSWAELIGTVERQVDPAHDVVLLQPPWEQRTFEYYYRGPAIELLGAHNYDDFFMGGGHSFSNPWTTDEVLSATRGRQRVWAFEYQTTGIQPVELPYRVIERWQSGKLKLVLYQVSPAP